MFNSKPQMKVLRIFSVIFLAAWCLFMFINYIVLADEIEPVAIIVMVLCLILLFVLFMYIK